MAKKLKFPKTVYFVWEADKGEFFLHFESANDAIEYAGHGGKVAIYELKEERVAEIDRTFRP